VRSLPGLLKREKAFQTEFLSSGCAADLNATVTTASRVMTGNDKESWMAIKPSDKKFKPNSIQALQRLRFVVLRSLNCT
jgi:hypothetical protein